MMEPTSLSLKDKFLSMMIMELTYMKETNPEKFKEIVANPGKWKEAVDYVNVIDYTI